MICPGAGPELPARRPLPCPSDSIDRRESAWFYRTISGRRSPDTPVIHREAILDQNGKYVCLTGQGRYQLVTRRNFCEMMFKTKNVCYNVIYCTWRDCFAAL